MNKIKLITAAIAITGIACICKVKEDKVLDFARNNTPVYSYYRKDGIKEAKALGINGLLEQDAFVHAFTSAKLTYKTNDKFVRFLGEVNEMARPKNPVKDKFMDLYNNEKGIEIGKMLKNKGLSLNNLSEIIKDSLKNGGFIVDTAKVNLPHIAKL